MIHVTRDKTNPPERKKFPHSYVGFLDESHWNNGRYRSVAMISMPVEALPLLDDDLRVLMEASSVEAVEFKKVRTVKYHHAARKVFDCTIARAAAQQVKIDVLVWDTYDERHSIEGRDDLANLEEMYYFLIRHCIHRRWHLPGEWILFPDEGTPVNWERVRVRVNSYKGAFYSKSAIETISPAESKSEKLIQVADLFAGIAVYSRKRYRAYLNWGHSQNDWPAVNPWELKEANRGEGQRFDLMERILKACRDIGMTTCLEETEGFESEDRTEPVNFWLYRSQHPADRAPTKMVRGVPRLVKPKSRPI